MFIRISCKIEMKRCNIKFERWWLIWWQTTNIMFIRRETLWMKGGKYFLKCLNSKVVNKLFGFTNRFRICFVFLSWKIKIKEKGLSYVNVVIGNIDLWFFHQYHKNHKLIPYPKDLNWKIHKVIFVVICLLVLYILTFCCKLLIRLFATQIIYENSFCMEKKLLQL